MLHHTRICIFKFVGVTQVHELTLLFQVAQGEPSRFPDVKICVEVSGKLSIAIILLYWAGR